VVLLEDLGALTGLVLALVGVSTAAITGDARWDAYGTIAIGVLLVVIAAILVFEMKSLLIGESARAPMRRQIVEAIESTEGLFAVLDLRTQHVGPDQILVGAEVEVDSQLTADEVAAAIDCAEAKIREVVPIAKMIYIEPEIPDDEPGLVDRD
jgi:divalent metal cation (Fe/Co/Zn/Cd) transporter